LQCKTVIIIINLTSPSIQPKPKILTSTKYIIFLSPENTAKCSRQHKKPAGVEMTALTLNSKIDWSLTALSAQ